MLELVIKTSGEHLAIVAGRQCASAELSHSGEIQCTSPGRGLFKLCRNDDGSVEAQFSDGSRLTVSNLRVD